MYKYNIALVEESTIQIKYIYLISSAYMRLTSFLWTIILIIFLWLILTYGRWEYLSYMHQDEFVDPIHNVFTEWCVLGDSPQTIKVMHYSDDRATIWMKGESESTYLIHFHKNGDNRSLQSNKNNNESFCNREIINSSMWGGADGWYWYW